jgi:DNA-binding beta-propeller fold protein YncE
VSKTIVGTVTGLTGPWYPRFSPESTKIYQPGLNNQTIAVIDVATKKITGTITDNHIGKDRPSISPDGKMSYAITGSGVLKNDVRTGKELERWLGVASGTVTFSPVAALSPDGTKLWTIATLPGSSNLALYGFDTTNPGTLRPALGATAFNGTVTGTIPITSAPHSMKFSPDNQTLYVLRQDLTQIAVVDTVKNVITKTIPTGAAPYGFDVTPDGSAIYVANLGSNNISFIT